MEEVEEVAGWVGRMLQAPIDVEKQWREETEVGKGEISATME